MIFKRKAIERLEEWKKNYADSYAILLEGARRVGKSTLAEEFAKKFSANVDGLYLLSGKDVSAEKTLKKKPVYMTPFIID